MIRSRFKSLGALHRFAPLALLITCTYNESPATTEPHAAYSNPVAPASDTNTIPNYSAELFYSSIELEDVAFSADGQHLLLSSNKTGVFNAFSIHIPSGQERQLTQSTKSAIRIKSWFPNDDRVLYGSDGEGDEIQHIFVREVSGKTHDLIPDKSARAQFMGWSRDGKSFFIASNERDHRISDIYRYSTETYQRKRIYVNESARSIGAISPDGRWIVTQELASTANTNLYLHDTINKKSKAKLLTPHQGDVRYLAFEFSPDSQSLYYGSNANSEYTRLWRFDLDTSKHIPIEFEIKDGDINFFRLSKSARYQIVGHDQNARTRVIVRDSSTGKTILSRLTGRKGTSTAFSPDEKRIALYSEDDHSPANLFVYELDTGAETQLSNTLSQDIDPKILVRGQDLSFKSYDGLEIPGILYRPRQATASTPVPALLKIHGGPGGQLRHKYDPQIQFLVNHGYAIFSVNHRGSSGYGKTFFHLDDRKHGDADLRDCLVARDYLKTLDWIDNEKIGILGASYGGYMVVAAMTFHPEAFRVGIDIFGVTNWIRTLGNIPPWWHAQRQRLYSELGDPYRDVDYLRSISPLFFADKIRRPMLVIQGATDPRVLKIESDELVAAMRKNNVPVDYLVFPDEGHGFNKRDNQISAAIAELNFLNTYLKVDSDSASARVRQQDTVPNGKSDQNRKALQPNPVRPSQPTH